MTAAQSRSASDLPTRLAMGLVLIASASLLIYFGGVTSLGGWIFRITVGLVAAAMLVEWSDLHRVPRGWAYVGGALLALLLVGAGEMLYPVGEKGEVLSAQAFVPVWYALAAIGLLGIAIAVTTRRLIMLIGILYVGIPAFALLILEWAWFGLTFWAMIVTWATDIFAYFTGRQVGGPKLAPRISPNKTWSGLVGGIVAAALFGGAAAWFFNLGMPFLAIGAALAVVAQAGDLYESWVKRRAGAKDSGTILPGHGGLLDRLDGLLPVVVVTLALLMAGLWAG